MFLIAVAIMLSFVFCTKGAPIEPPPKPEFPMGSEDVVISNSVFLVSSLDVRLSIMKNETQSTFLTNILENRTFSSKAELDGVMRERAKILVQSLSNWNNLDFSKQLKLIVSASAANPVVVSISIFTLEDLFYINQAKGDNIPPIVPPSHLDTLVLPLPAQVIYKVPAPRWVMLEFLDVYFGDHGILDSRKTTEIGLNNQAGFIKLPVTLVTNSEYMLNMCICTGSGNNTSFYCYDPQGRVRLEKPVKLALAKNNLLLTLSVTGGEMGRVVRILESTNLVTWTNSTVFLRQPTLEPWVTNLTKTVTTPNRYFGAEAPNSLLP